MSTNTPRFSVIVTNYNYADYLQAAVESVLAQTVRDFEVIIVDDGSTDGSHALIERLCKADPRVRACYQGNSGQAGAFNRGFDECRGRIICLMDADDLWMPHKLERVGRAFSEARGAALVQHQMLVLRPGRKHCPRYRETLVSGIVLDKIARLREFDYYVPTSGLALPRAVVKKISPIPSQLRICADAFVTRAAMAHGRLHSIDVPLAYYRVHGNNNWVENSARQNPKALIDEILWLVLDHYRANGVEGVLERRPAIAAPAAKPAPTPPAPPRVKHESWLMANVAVRRMRELKKKYRRIALYGAGAHTTWLMDLLSATDTFPSRMPEIVAVLDHMAETRPQVAGFTVQRPQDVPSSTFDAIVLSTSCFQVPMRKRLRAVYKRPTMIDLFEGLPTEWFAPISGDDYLAAIGKRRKTPRRPKPAKKTSSQKTASQKTASPKMASLKSTSERSTRRPPRAA
jgi:glycosyltransferase involved in cell wall biosynthesis